MCVACDLREIKRLGWSGVKRILLLMNIKSTRFESFEASCQDVLKHCSLIWASEWHGSVLRWIGMTLILKRKQRFLFRLEEEKLLPHQMQKPQMQVKKANRC